MPTKISTAKKASVKQSNPGVAKKQPAQQRATETYERILEITALTLADVGVARLSTNLVCERAGITPPALYRYFADKYALLSELGQRLMLAQNERVDRHINVQVISGEIAEFERAMERLILDTYQVTEQTLGGVWIMRALRALPALQQIRLESHRAVAHAQAELLAQALPLASMQELHHVSRIVVELVYATVEMMFDEQIDVQAVARIVAAMIAGHLNSIRSSDAPKRKTTNKAATRR